MAAFWTSIAAGMPTQAAAILTDMVPVLAVVFGLALLASVLTVVVRVVR